METIFMNTENSKTNKPNKSVRNLLQRLDLKNSNKNVIPLDLFIIRVKIQGNSTKT